MQTEDAANNTSKQVEANFCRDHEISNEWNLRIMCYVYDQSRQKFVTLTRIFCVLTRNCRPSRDKSNVQSRKILTDNFRYSFL